MQTAEDFAQMLLALGRTLDSHVERYDGEVLPSILRALFHKGAMKSQEGFRWPNDGKAL
jgi:hypothetical protein